MPTATLACKPDVKIIKRQPEETSRRCVDLPKSPLSTKKRCVGKKEGEKKLKVPLLTNTTVLSESVFGKRYESIANNSNPLLPKGCSTENPVPFRSNNMELGTRKTYRGASSHVNEACFSITMGIEERAGPPLARGREVTQEAK